MDVITSNRFEYRIGHCAVVLLILKVRMLSRGRCTRLMPISKIK